MTSRKTVPSAHSASHASAGGREAARAAYGGWCVFLAMLMTATLALIGLGLDWLRYLSPETLFISVTAASLLGVSLAGVMVWPWVVRRWERLVLLVLLYAAWRCCHFPVLQMAVLAAGTSAGFAIHLPWVKPSIHPVLLSSLGLLHLASGLLAAWPLAARRPWLIPVAWLPLVLGGLVSFCAWQDVHPLPDRGYATVVIASEMPTAPSLAGVLRHSPEAGWNERLRYQLAQWIYARRHRSPWLTVVQGTLARGLAQASVDRAAAKVPAEISSTRFLQAYYAAIIASQDFTGAERLMVRRPSPVRRLR